MHWPMTLPSTCQRANRCIVPIALVVIGHRAGAPLVHRRTGFGTVQRLNLAFGVDAENRGLVQQIELSPTTSSAFAAEEPDSRETLKVSIKYG